MRPASSRMRRAGVAFALLLCARTGATATPDAATAPSADYRQVPRLALVIGNTDYAGTLALRNAGRDARLVEQRLRQAGYATTLLLNTDRAALYRAVGTLANGLRDGGVGVVYYAGHGAELQGRNVLVPVDAPARQASAAAAMSMPVDYLIERLRDSGAHLSILLLDACRNAADGGLAPLYRGASATGFGAARPANGMLVAYATQPGERALDGDGANGPFALALGNWLTQPGMPLEQALKHVMADVRKQTRDEQRPWVATSLVGDFALVPAPAATSLLYRARAGTNVDGSRARALARSADAGILQWFQGQETSAQMRLAYQVTQQAKGLDAGDLPRLTRQARGGSVVAQAVLGVAWRQGFGAGMQLRRSHAEALRWLRMAAAQSMPFAANELGEMYYLGHGVDRDERRARAYFAAAAEQGFTPAKLNLLQLDADSGRLGPEQLLRMLGQPGTPPH